MKLAAYILLADPTWLQASVTSYYPHVDRIVASFDHRGLGWTGHSAPIDECIAKLEFLDVDHKVTWLAGDFSDPSSHPLELETLQRQTALDEASSHAEWVLQFDTDEVLPRWSPFARWLAQADTAGWDSFWYPQRFLFASIGGRWFLAPSMRRRPWRLVTTPPGPYAVRAGTKLALARQDAAERHIIAARRYFMGPNSIRAADAVVHYAWVRPAELMCWKSKTSGHSRDFDWEGPMAEWHAAHARPWRFTFTNLVSPGSQGPLMPTRIASAPSPTDQEWGR